jgi:hypothetical protein
MPAATDTENYQSRFHRRWSALNDPHVRALAWLLDAPDLLDIDAPQWRDRIATLGPVTPKTDAWLRHLDRHPEPLYAYLGAQPYRRLGRYAEKLMAFYFQHQGTLIGHGLQVRAGKNETIGEFDFLLREGSDLVHWEFASKFYLLETSGAEEKADHFVGPNLADTLGAKVRKIMERQLALSKHPAALAVLSEPVAAAKALVKGWLFYYRKTPSAKLFGVAHPHCHGFWRPLAELGNIVGEYFMILPRLSWLAPAKTTIEAGMPRHELNSMLDMHFERDSMPVMIAVLERQDDRMIEVDRGFIVPDDWRMRAAARDTRGRQ